MRNTRVARRYAGALMEAVEASGAVEAVRADLEQVARAMEVSRELRLLAASPVVSPAKKAAVFRALFASRVAPVTLDFLALVIGRKREAHLAEIAAQFGLLADAKSGTVTVEVASAVALTAGQEADLARALERARGGRARVRNTVDPSLKGGLTVRIGDTVMDASIRRQLELLRERLVAGGGVE